MKIKITLPVFLVLLGLLILETAMYFSFGIGGLPIKQQAAQVEQYRDLSIEAGRHREAVLARADRRRQEEMQKMTAEKAARDAVWAEIERQGGVNTQ